jgi:hypothetical protein
MRAPEPDDHAEADAEAREQEPPDQRGEPVRRTGPVVILR